VTIATEQKANLLRKQYDRVYYVAPQNLPRPAVYHPQPKATSPQPRPKAQRRFGGWALALGAAALILLALLWVAREPLMSLLAMVKHQQAVSDYLRGFGAWGPLALVLAQIIQVMLAFIPGHVFLVAAGYVYGFTTGLLLNYAGIVVASQLAFGLARWAGRPLVSRLVSADLLDRWYQIGERQGFTFFTIAFVLPVFPTDLMNFVAGLSGISAMRFLAANMLGRLPGAILLTLIGSHGLQISSLTWGGLALLVIALYLGGRVIVGHFERSTTQSVSSSAR
jgi:uncharacterized membrane protein YdjX (TVP38/TMEM64 family)